MEWIQTDTGAAPECRELVESLAAYNRSRTRRAAIRPVGIYLKDAGRVAAGISGYTHGSCLFIQYLWVEQPLRGRGVGSRLLRQAEQEALLRGCSRAFVDTFEFQAPAFYHRHGYQTVYTLQEHPATGDHYFLAKDLPAPPAEADGPAPACTPRKAP